MTRLAVLALLSTLIAMPAAAQVINGETPLDETSPNRETPRQAPSPDEASPRPSAAAPAPVHDVAPAAGARHD